MLNIDRAVANEVVAGVVVVRPPNVVGWILDKSVDVIRFSDGTSLHVGQPATWFGVRPDGSAYWYDGIVSKLKTTGLKTAPDGSSIPTVNVYFDHNNNPDDEDIILSGITSVRALPDKEKFLSGRP